MFWSVVPKHLGKYNQDNGDMARDKKTLQKLYKPTEESLWHTLKFTCSENKSRGTSNRVVLTAETSVWATEQPDLTAK